MNTAEQPKYAFPVEDARALCEQLRREMQNRSSRMFSKDRVLEIVEVLEALCGEVNYWKKIAGNTSKGEP